MAAIDFPNSPSNNDIFTSQGKSWKYNGVKGVWKTVSTTTTANLQALGESVIPSANVTYDLGSSTNAFRDLYLSGSSINLGEAEITASGSSIVLPAGSQVGGITLGTGGATQYANTSLLPKVNLTAGQFAFVGNTLFMTNGQGWYSVALINQTPSLTLSTSSISLGVSGNTINFTFTATDPDGPTPTVTATTTANTSQANVTLHSANSTVTVENLSADAFTANVTITATDGINQTFETVTLTVSYANYDLSTYSLTSSREVATAYSITREGSVWVDPAGNYFAGVGRTDLTVRIFNSTNGEIASGSQYRTFGISGTATYPGGIFIHPNGSKLWVFDGGGSENLYSWDLSTPFDVSTASNLSTVTLNDISAASYGGTFAFSSDGSYMWSDGGGTVGITSWSLSTPYDASSRTVIRNSYITTSLEWGSNQAHMSTFSPDGTHWIVYGGDANNGNAKSIFAYSLSTPYDPSTTSTLVGKTTVNNQGGGYNNNGIHFVNDAVTFYDRNFGYYRQYSG